MNSVRSAIVAFLCAVFALFVGIWLGGHPENLPGVIQDAFVDEDRALRAEVIDTIEDNFYREVDGEKLEDASLKGIVDSLEDPYSHYLTPEEASQFNESVSGEFEGVGMNVEEDRRGLEVPVATGRVAERSGERVGVVELVSFSSGAHGILRREIDELLEKGAEGIVLDLRGNGGGLLTEAQLVSSIFIEDGKIVSTRGRSRPERTLEAEGDAIEEDIPVVVLVDGGSASASEIVTGALRDRGRATIVGTRTFGKGLVQEVKPLSNGGDLDITVANYYLPGGKTISKAGIKPQVKARD